MAITELDIVRMIAEQKEPTPQMIGDVQKAQEDFLSAVRSTPGLGLVGLGEATFNTVNLLAKHQDNKSFGWVVRARITGCTEAYKELRKS